MENCSFLSGCPFYNDKMENKPALASMYKKNYCEGNYADCARWKIATTVGRPAVPADLFPNQHDRAELILQERS
jgi:hypothetical protein